MMMTDLVIWTSAGLLLAMVGLNASVALMERPIHHGDRLDRLLDEVMAKKGDHP